MTLVPLIGDADPSTRVLQLPLAALTATADELKPVSFGLPAGAVAVATANVVLAATPCEPTLFRDVIERHGREYCRDVMLVRTGLWPETLNAVTVEVALAVDGDALLVTDLAFFRRVDGSLWLIPPRAAPFIAIGPDGLGLEMSAPFSTASERSAGLCRAAAEIVRLVRSGRGR